MDCRRYSSSEARLSLSTCRPGAPWGVAGGGQDKAKRRQAAPAFASWSGEERKKRRRIANGESKAGGLDESNGQGNAAPSNLLGWERKPTAEREPLPGRPLVGSASL